MLLFSWESVPHRQLAGDISFWAQYPDAPWTGNSCNILVVLSCIYCVVLFLYSFAPEVEIHTSGWYPDEILTLLVRLSLSFHVNCSS